MGSGTAHWLSALLLLYSRCVVILDLCGWCHLLSGSCELMRGVERGCTQTRWLGEGVASLQSSQPLPQAPWSSCFAGLPLGWAQQPWGLWAELAEPPSQGLVLCIARLDLERGSGGGSGQMHLTQHRYKVLQSPGPDPVYRVPVLRDLQVAAMPSPTKSVTGPSAQ